MCLLKKKYFTNCNIIRKYSPFLTSDPESCIELCVFQCAKSFMQLF